MVLGLEKIKNYVLKEGRCVGVSAVVGERYLVSYRLTSKRLGQERVSVRRFLGVCVYKCGHKLVLMDTIKGVKVWVSFSLKSINIIRFQRY